MSLDPDQFYFKTANHRGDLKYHTYRLSFNAILTVKYVCPSMQVPYMSKTPTCCPCRGHMTDTQSDNLPSTTLCKMCRPDDALQMVDMISRNAAVLRMSCSTPVCLVWSQQIVSPQMQTFHVLNIRHTSVNHLKLVNSALKVNMFVRNKP